MTSNNKVKVLTIGSSPKVKGGITTVIQQFLTCDWNDIQMSFLSTYIEGNKFKQMLYFLVSLIKYFAVLCFNRPDLVHIHMSYKGSFYRKLTIVKLSKMFRIKVVLHLHGSEFKLFYENSNFKIRQKIQWLFETVEQTIVLGQDWKDYIESIAPKSNAIVFNNAVMIPKYKIERNSKEFNFLFLAVLLKRKGIYDLLEVIQKLKSEEIFNQYQVKFTIAGDGPESDRVKLLIESNQLESVIEMTGWVDNEKKQKLLKDAQALVLPSYNEGLPMAILEAMSYGIPVISTDVGSIGEVIIPEETGILINPGNQEQLKKAIIDLITKPDLWKKLSLNSRVLIEEKYNQKIYLQKFEQNYIQLTKL